MHSEFPTSKRHIGSVLAQWFGWVNACLCLLMSVPSWGVCLGTNVLIDNGSIRSVITCDIVGNQINAIFYRLNGDFIVQIGNSEICDSGFSNCGDLSTGLPGGGATGWYYFRQISEPENIFAGYWEMNVGFTSSTIPSLSPAVVKPIPVFSPSAYLLVALGLSGIGWRHFRQRGSS